jgi:hypothetical protein
MCELPALGGLGDESLVLVLRHPGQRTTRAIVTWFDPDGSRPLDRGSEELQKLCHPRIIAGPSGRRTNVLVCHRTVDRNLDILPARKDDL